jgi:hypothetical protein
MKNQNKPTINGAIQQRSAATTFSSHQTTHSQATHDPTHGRRILRDLAHRQQSQERDTPRRSPEQNRLNLCSVIDNALAIVENDDDSEHSREDFERWNSQ